MTIIDKTDNKLTIPVGIGVVQTETTRNFYNTSDATATANDILVNKTAYSKYGKLTGTLDLDAEKGNSYTEGYNNGYNVGNEIGYSNGETNGYNNGYNEGVEVGYNDGYSNGESAGYSTGYDEGVIAGYDSGVEIGKGVGRNEIITEQSDANITPSKVLKGYIGYSANNERIVGESDAITTIDVAASGIKFGYSSFTEIPSYYDFNNVTNMSNMFYQSSSITTVPLFDTSNVTNMNNMFNGCSNLTSVPEFDTSNVTNMSYMFSGCYKLTSVPEFDTSKVANMNDMFYNCWGLITIPPINCSLLITFPTAYYSAPLYSCDKLENFGGFVDLGKNFTGSSSKTFYMGTNHKALTRESMINTFNALYDLTTTFTGTAQFYVSKYPYAKITDDDIAIATSKGWTILQYNG